MSSFRYRATPPEAEKASYGQNDKMDFILNIEPGMAIRPNSIAISGRLTCRKKTPAQMDAGCRLDGETGIHQFFNSFVLKNRYGDTFVRNYPRFVKMYKRAMKRENFVSASDSCELICPTDAIMTDLVRTDALRSIPFCFKPMIPWNRIINGGQLSAMNGQLKLHCMTSSNDNVFYATDADDTEFVIQDLLVHYETVPYNSKLPKPIMLSYDYVPNSISSNNATLNTVIPDNVRGVSVSFIDNAKLAVANQANPRLPLDYLPNLREVKINVNDVNSPIGFTMNQDEEFIGNYLLSFDADLSNPNSFYNRTSFIEPAVTNVDLTKKLDGIGMGFNKNLRSQKISINLISDIATEHNCEVFAHTSFEGI